MSPDFERRRMVREQIVARGIRDPRVIDALLAVPRERFVPDESRDLAYADHPLPIGHGQTISQPYIVALMTELLRLPEDATVLEIGAGCGYQTAVLAQLARRVCAIERDPDLAEGARHALKELGDGRVAIEIVTGDGFDGWPDASLRFDGILIACAPDHIPEKPAASLKPGARMVVPVGPPHDVQDLTVVTRMPDGTLRSTIATQVRFVPMV